MVQRIIGGILVAVIGILLIADPHGAWAVTERWKLLGAAEMSPLFEKAVCIVGIVCLVVGILVTIGILS